MSGANHPTSKTVAHTPGPWGLEVTEDNLLIYYPVPAGSKVLATIDTGFDEPFESQQWANANLMRAAPDLLAAANAVLRDFMPMFPDSRAVDDCLVQLAAAVAKAEA